MFFSTGDAKATFIGIGEEGILNLTSHHAEKLILDHNPKHKS